jgi:GMP synthase (glutamine-hydrolysing)
MLTQYEVYEKVLRDLTDNNLNITTIHPACTESFLPTGINLDDFQGVVWTGSLLNIYDLGPSITRQIELANELFKKKNKIFGSCWGLQVLATAAGGTVRKNPRGLEAVIAKNITINDEGLKHNLYKNKPKIFDSFCWHYDEVENLPSETKILSFNEKSSIQSIAFTRDKSEIWAVQYHPEFNPKWISGLMKQRKSLLLQEGVYSNHEEFEKFFSFLSDVEKLNVKKDKLLISETITNSKVHTLELSNWLHSFMNDI